MQPKKIQSPNWTKSWLMKDHEPKATGTHLCRFVWCFCASGNSSAQQRWFRRNWDMRYAFPNPDFSAMKTPFCIHVFDACNAWECFLFASAFETWNTDHHTQSTLILSFLIWYYLVYVRKFLRSILQALILTV